MHKFRQLILRDFKSFAGEHVISLGGQPGLIYVCGENEAEPRLGANGVGKSTIWDGLVWCLYGYTVKGLRNADIRPWHGKHKTSVAVKFTHSSGSKHVIERAVHPNKLLLDGKDVGQEEINKLIGLPYAVFINTVIQGQGRPLFLDMSPRDKMALLSDVKDLDKWETRSKRASEATAKLQSERSDLVREKDTIEAGLAYARQNLKDIKKRSEEWETLANKKHSARKEQLAKLIKKRDDLQKRVDTATLAYDGAGTEKKHHEEKVYELRSRLSDAQTLVSKAEALEELADKRTAALKKKRKELRTEKTCPTCGQAVKSKDLSKHIAELDKELDLIEQGRERMDLPALQKQVKNLKRQIEQEENHYNGFKIKEDKALATLELLKPDLVEVKIEISKLTEARAEVNPYVEQRAQVRDKIAKLKKDLQSVEEDIEAVDTEIIHTSYWIKGFKDVRLYIIEEFLQELTMHTVAALEEIGLIGWNIRYEIEKQTKSGSSTPGLHVLVSSPKSKTAVRWESWSGGEAQRLRLVGSMALSTVLLNHAGLNFNIEVLDEPSQHLHATGIEDLLALLDQRAERLSKRIYYTDHNETTEYRFTDTMLVVRDKKGSYVYEDQE